MTNPNAYLRLAFRQWQMTRRIPGTKKRLVVNLGTGDIVEARKKRDQVWAAFLGEQKTHEEEALQLAEEHDPDDEGLGYFVSDWAERLEAKVGEEEAVRLYKIATRQHTPITAHLEAFLLERPCAINTRLARLSTIKNLPFNFVQDINQKNAGQSVSELARRMNSNTVNGKISHLRIYWEFLKSKGVVKANPWIGQSVKRDRRIRPGSRVWTFPEVAKMLTQCRPEFQLVLRTLVYSGCRIGELANLQADHMTPDGFEVKEAKTEAGERRVYLPSSLVRALGKQTGYVFLPTIQAEAGRGRPGAFSKLLSDELRRLFPEHDTGQQRNSVKTSHGLRKLWATVAEQEGVPVHLIQAACGHQRSGVTLSVYSAGPSQSQIRDVFAKVAQRVDDELISGSGEGRSEEARGLSP